MITCKYTSSASDYSGYGQAGRTFITSLYLSGVDIAAETVCHVAERGSFGWMGALCKNLEDRNLDYKIKIIHLTPDCYGRYAEEEKYNIGHLFWETDRLPKEWVKPCNTMNEIWTASEQQAEMIKSSGVTVPVFCFSQPIDMSISDKKIEPLEIPSWDKANGTIFYSVFQWIDRKNPEALIRAYLKTFSDRKDVVLVLKTYGVNYSENQFDIINEKIKSIRTQVSQGGYPRIILLKSLLSANEIFRLHQMGDVYVSTTRGEGWGIPVVEAMLLGKPVVSIDKTGIFDLVPQNAYYSCPTTKSVVVQNPSIPWYYPPQEWLEINEESLAENMLSCYNNRDIAKFVGRNAQKFVKENFDFWTIGKKMKERLETIESGL